MSSKNRSVKHVILTGGVGSRLWPLSRKSKPKQYLNMFNGESLFAMTVLRNIGISEEVMVVGSVDNYQLSNKAVESIDISVQNIVEATPRDTAAAIAFAAFAANKDDILIVTPSDHIIQNKEAYNAAVEKAVNLAEQDYIVTFGIEPTKPETGYGYIEYESDNVIAFREKPNRETAEEFIDQGNFLWNSGMFCFKASVLLDELEEFEPQIFEFSKKAWESNIEGKLGKEESMKIPKMSIDYAVMERSRKIKVVKGAFDWSDLGSFESVYDYLKHNGHEVDENGNMVIGTEKYSAFVGLKNAIFVYTDDANLILQKEKAQDVKKVYNKLNKLNSKFLD